MIEEAGGGDWGAGVAAGLVEMEDSRATCAPCKSQGGH